MLSIYCIQFDKEKTKASDGATVYSWYNISERTDFTLNVTVNG